MKILAISAHPDDLELGCFGTLKKFKDQGAEIDIIITTSGGYITNKNLNKRGWKLIVSEAIKSSNLLGASIEFLDNKILNLKSNGKNIRILDEKLKSKNYDLLITHSPNDFHQDHKETWNMVNPILRNFNGKVWQMEIALYSYKISAFEPNVYVDVSDYWEFKVECLNCYSSYVNKEILSGVESLAKYRSNVIKEASHVESFFQIQEIIN